MTAAQLRYVLDTDAVTYHQLGRSEIIARLAQLDPHQVATTIVTLEEQIQGRLAVIRRQRDIGGLTRSYQAFQMTHSYFCRIPVLPFDERAFAIYQELLQQQLRIGTQDLRIAAITLAHSAILVTRNRRHFDRVPVLLVEEWASM
jgi:tRNA(fMet)-specific endonuclease VapC